MTQEQVVKRVIDDLMMNRKIDAALAKAYIDDLESGFDPAAYPDSMTDEELLEDVRCYELAQQTVSELTPLPAGTEVKPSETGLDWRCDCCGQEILIGLPVGDFIDGWRKKADEYEPSGTEWMLCSGCTQVVTEFLEGIRKEAHNG